MHPALSKLMQAGSRPGETNNHIDSFAAQPKELICHVLLSATLSAASWSTVMEKLCHYILFFRLQWNFLLRIELFDFSVEEFGD